LADDLVQSEAFYYTGAYFTAIAALALWEWLAPRRTPIAPLGRRWASNAALALIDTALIRLAFPAVGVAFAIMVADRGIGLFHAVAAPLWLALPVTFLAVDLARYATHRLLHVVPLLWRLHGPHHTDHELDFSTALRFHPLESLVTTGVSLAVVAALGAPPVAIIVAEVVFMVSTLFNHGNIRLPGALERALRAVLVTPDMHRIHHSAAPAEADSNYATLFSFWDRLFGPYRGAPAAGRDAMTVGVPGYGDRKHLGLGWMLAFPFLRASPEPSSTPRAGLKPAPTYQRDVS